MSSTESNKDNNTESRVEPNVQLNSSEPSGYDQQYDEAQEARRAFTANVSHELKTPLTVILGYSELLKDGSVAPEDTTKVSSVIYEEARYMLSLVDDILTLSQLDEYNTTGNTSAHAVLVDLAAITADVLERLEPFAEQNSIQCTFELIGNGTTEVMGIERLLTSIVYNLSENAVRYNVPGGKVTITIEGQDDSVRLAVTDTGLGIAEQDQPRIFERFYRVDQAHSRHSGGTGLGLAIVKHGAQYHKASLLLKSELQKGTEVTVVFPR